MSLFFPGKGGGAVDNTLYSMLVGKVKMMLDEIMSDVNKEREIEQAGFDILCFFSPIRISGAEGAEVAHIKTFEELCFLVDMQGNTRAKKMTVLELFNALETIKKNGRKSYKNK